MQVKKFEARTMKEALEMVKTQLGPDAIILSARDNNKSYGLVGEGSVEITAAVSEETLQKKKFAESKLRQQDLEKFNKFPARQQKEMITKMVEKHLERNQPPAPITKRRYIDIDEDQTPVPAPRAQQAQARQAYNPRAAAPTQQQQQAQPQQQMQRQMPVQAPVPATVPRGESEEMRALRNEIATLKQVITQFQQMPQSFAGSHPGADYGLPYDLSFVFSKLVDAGMAPEITAEILTKAQESLPALKMKNKALVDAWVARHVLENTKISEKPSFGKVHCFVGPAGAGKTSAMIKMASHLVVKEGKRVALFTTDTYKVGSADQMRIFAQILNVPFSVIRTQGDWTNLLRYLANVDCVLVDYTGLSLKNQDEVNMIRGLLPPQSLQAQCHLVLPANAKDQDATELGRRYAAVGYKDVIFTGLDESTQHGTIYNFMKRFDVPLHSFGIGPRVPEDFEFATKERLLDLIFKITKLNQQESQSI